MRIQLKNSYLFIFLVALVYSMVFVASDWLQGPLWDDEIGFWRTSLTFSQQLIPSFAQIQDYDQFSTPVPFILFGMLEYLFNLGPFAARMVSFLSSLGIAWLIGWPGKQGTTKPIFSLLGLFLFPFFLLLSGRLYTDVIAAFLGLVGVVLYLRDRHISSGVMFVLAIACRQFMLAFPVAIAAHELARAISGRRWPSLSFFLPAGAALTIMAWVVLFGGLAPATATADRWMPSFQSSLFSFSIENGLFFLSTLGWAYVIPEFLYKTFLLKDFKPNLSRSNLIKLLIIAVAVGILFLLFPPSVSYLSVFYRVVIRLPSEGWALAIFASLGILTCWRFARLDLAFSLILFNFLIMTKAIAWDKYALPIIVIFWYFQARDIYNRHDFNSFNIYKGDSNIHEHHVSESQVKLRIQDSPRKSI
ncbi:hypothetical protein [Nodosilinea sp. E11]|uniref:hypothetical protein n=1 Tax=Nodosilinea sp. E11 TaxID=3037479 RepID=UPI002935242D|nr:hypothetical protein [Nodosilinea sp. E11]WOD39258.1 hypothetical protein RRF56_23915 [Nodosilinea sp. E11]